MEIGTLGIILGLGLALAIIGGCIHAEIDARRREKMTKNVDAADAVWPVIKEFRPDGVRIYSEKKGPIADIGQVPGGPQPDGKEEKDDRKY